MDPTPTRETVTKLPPPGIQLVQLSTDAYGMIVRDTRGERWFLGTFSTDDIHQQTMNGAKDGER